MIEPKFIKNSWPKMNYTTSTKSLRLKVRRLLALTKKSLNEKFGSKNLQMLNHGVKRLKNMKLDLNN